MRTSLVLVKTYASEIAFAIALGLVWILSGCTNQILGSNRYIPKEGEIEPIALNTKVDLLWVIDNSASMDPFQATLRAGISGFTKKYMNPNWDIRTAVITTDTYLANPAFQKYLGKPVTGLEAGKQASGYILNLFNQGKWRKPAAWSKDIFNPASSTLTRSVTVNDLVPAWGPDYAKLLPGNHDGPISGLCFEGLKYFFLGNTACTLRDDYQTYSGADHCLNPGANESGLTQCVNTAINDTIHSGRAIISTLPPVGVPADANWTAQLIKDFTINVTTGSVGHGSERGLSSVLQFLNDNETNPATTFFRKGSVRVVLFVGDEEDQSIEIPSQAPATYEPFTEYKCDSASWKALNPTRTADIDTNCCATCTYGKAGTSCPSKTVDGFTYTPSVCPDETKLIPVSRVKTALDTYFAAIDGAAADQKTYFVGSLVSLTGASIQKLQAQRDQQDTALNSLLTTAVDRADRYIELGNLVGNGSMAYDIGSNDYMPLLDQVGRTVVYKRGKIDVNFPINPDKQLSIIRIIYKNGTVLKLANNQYEIGDRFIQITDIDLLLGMGLGDKISVYLQPIGRAGL
jgi:hypothetical protein